MATQNSRWSREELLVAFNLYCQMPFGKMHSRNPAIIRVAGALGRTPSSVAMKLVNFASLDPSITSTGRSGLGNASRADRAIWDEFNGDWGALAVESETHLKELVSKGATAPPKPSSDFDDFDEADYEGQTKAVQIQARIKQAFFRKAVLSSYGGRCCITRIVAPPILKEVPLCQTMQRNAGRLTATASTSTSRGKSSTGARNTAAPSSN